MTDPDQRRQRARQDAKNRRGQEKREQSKHQHCEKAGECEREMNEQAMPPWARAILHQQKAIMAELGITHDTED